MIEIEDYCEQPPGKATTIKCEGCSKVLTERNIKHRAKFCSGTCRERNYSKFKWGGEKRKHLSSGSIGAMHELLVCYDLLMKGYSVFRAVSPSSPCDLIILKDQELKRVEVTTGFQTKKGKIVHTKSKKSKEFYDILSVVIDEKVHYNPEI